MIKEEIQQLFKLGKNAFKEKRYEEAISNLEKIIDIYNKDLVFYSDDEFIIYSDDNDDGDETNAEDINNMHNILISAYYNIGTSKCNLKEYEESIKYFDKTLELNNEYCNAYYSRGVAKYSLGSYEDAIKDFNKTLELDSDFKDAYFVRALSYAKIDKHKEAIDDFNRLLIEYNEINYIYY